MSSVALQSTEIRFHCRYEWDTGEVDEWDGGIVYLKKSVNQVEFEIISRSSIYVICGKGVRGYWACIPDYFGGCSLSSWLNDTFYNTEKLFSSIDNMVDAVTIAQALKLIGLKKYL